MSPSCAPYGPRAVRLERAPGFQIGAYSGSGIGLSSGGDAVNIFNATGNHLTGVKFGAATANVSFDNAAGLGSFTPPLPAISKLSVVTR